MSEEHRLAYPALIVAILAVSFASIFIRWSDSDPLVIAGYRMLFAALILAPFAFQERRVAEPLERRTIMTVVMTGVVLAVHFFAFISSLRYTSVASSTLLVNCHPLIVGAASVFLLRESSRRTIVGVTIGFVGVAVIALSGIGSGQAIGDSLALLGGVMAAIYILAGRLIRRSLGIFTYAFLVYITAAVVLMTAALLNGVPLWPYPVDEILIFLALAVVCTIFGHTIYNWSLRYLSAPVISTSLLGEPIIASMLAFIILSEVPGWTVIMAAPLVLIGVLLTVQDRAWKKVESGK
ncbi:MAG TPA: DMT family transporter [Methanomassiliicoccales archaeon]|nr:DMT family transporter [Methanomassiliicoccales archaeon]